METYIRLEKINRVGYIVMDRPKANCYEINFHRQLVSCVDAANMDDKVKIIVLKSAIPRFFSAGADVKVFSANSTEENKKMVELAKLAANKLSESYKITIAAIAGHALGGGLELALACDMRIAAEGDYFLGLPEIKLGLIPGNGGSQRLIRLIGKSKALELLITGDNIYPAEAYKLGLINRLFKADEFDQNLEDYANKLASGPLQAMAAAKVCVNKGIEMPLEDGLKLENEMVEPLYDSEDAKEGSLAFVEKRSPKFR